MTVSLSREYGPKIWVNTLSTGPFLTDIAQAWDPARRESQPVALGRPGHPPEIATAALMLASRASSYTTGALLRVDGGQQPAWPVSRSSAPLAYRYACLAPKRQSESESLQFGKTSSYG